METAPVQRCFGWLALQHELTAEDGRQILHGERMNPRRRWINNPWRRPRREKLNLWVKPCLPAKPAEREGKSSGCRQTDRAKELWRILGVHRTVLADGTAISKACPASPWRSFPGNLRTNGPRALKESLIRWTSTATSSKARCIALAKEWGGSL